MKISRVLFAHVLIIAVCLFMVARSSAQIPLTISYQGILTDASGAPVPDGPVTLTFRFFDVASGGTALWQETQQVTIAKGLFSVALGAVTPLGLPFDKPYWIGITVGQGTELAPRTALTAAPYSLNSHSTIAEPQRGQGITIRDSSGTVAHQLSPDGNVSHSGTGTFLGGIVVGDTVVVPPDTIGVNGVSGRPLQKSAGGKSVAALPAIGLQGGGSDVGVFGYSLEGGRGVIGQSKSNAGVFGISETGVGLSAHSKGNSAVHGVSENFHGVFGVSDKFHGVRGVSRSTTAPGVSGFNVSGGAGVEGEGNPAVYAKGQLKVDNVPLGSPADPVLVWGEDHIVKLRTMVFSGVLNNTPLILKDAVGTEVFRVNPDGTSFHKGEETFAGGVNVTGGIVRSGDNVFYDAEYVNATGSSPLARVGAAGEPNVLYFARDSTGSNTAGLFTSVSGERPSIYAEKKPSGSSGSPFSATQALHEQLESLSRAAAHLQGIAGGASPQSVNQTNLPSIWGVTSMTDNEAILGQNSSSTSTSGAVRGVHVGRGAGVIGQIGNSASTAPAVWGLTNGTGSGVASTVTGNGTGLLIDHNGSTGHLAVFRSGSSSQIRFDKTGKGFFNGGTQTGGADVAEAFEVEGMIMEYEPGDVLVISTESDRTMEKSNAPYSTFVAGVHATKPGVLLTERDVEDSHEDTVPLGVVGVIPTKVCGENGAIRRGDLLVTSSTPGHAMRGTERERMLGAVLGKALENFDGKGTGVIKVLVNVK